MRNFYTLFHKTILTLNTPSRSGYTVHIYYSESCLTIIECWLTWTEIFCSYRLKYVALHYSCSPELQLLDMGLCSLGKLLTPLLLWDKICNYTFLNALMSLSLPKLLEYITQSVMTEKEVCEGPELQVSLAVL